MTVNELLYHALRLAGVIQLTGRTASQGEMDDAFDLLNMMLDAFLADGLLYYATPGKQCPLTASKGVYTIGIGGEFNMPRPPLIQAASILVGIVTQPVKVCAAPEWAVLDNKEEISSFGPDNLFYEPLMPLGNVYIAPKPMAVMTMTLYCPLPISPFTDQDAVISLPPAYLKLILYNLAVEVSLSPRFRRFPMDPLVVAIARDTRAELVRFNAALNLGATPPAEVVKA